MNLKLSLIAVAVGAISMANALDLQVHAGALGGNVIWELNDHNASTSDVHHTFAGQLNIAVKNGTTYTGYCVDAKTAALSGYNPFDKLDTSDLHTYNPAASGKIGYLVQNVSPGVTTKEQGIAMQLAIWDLLYDPAPNSVGQGTGHGDFFVHSIDGYNATQSEAIVNQANAYAATTGSATAIYFKAASDCPPNQSFVVTTPEPASLASIGLGVAAMLRRRKKGKR